MGIVIESEDQGPKTGVSCECEGAQKLGFLGFEIKKINE